MKNVVRQYLFFIQGVGDISYPFNGNLGSIAYCIITIMEATICFKVEYSVNMSYDVPVSAHQYYL